MVLIKTAREIEKIRMAAQAVAETLRELGDLVRPGATTRELDRFAEGALRARGCEPAFKGYRGYPATICASPNEVVVHGIPSDRPLAEGDILSVDLGARYEGWHGDAAVTFPVGEVPVASRQLIAAAEGALRSGIEAARPGNRLGDVSHAIQVAAEGLGYAVVRDYVGHGIGRKLHEDPQVPNFGKPGVGPRLAAGMVLAIEPMINEGTWRVEVLEDGWTVVTGDRRRSAHAEHTVAVTTDGPEILTLPVAGSRGGTI